MSIINLIIGICITSINLYLHNYLFNQSLIVIPLCDDN